MKASQQAPANRNFIHSHARSLASTMQSFVITLLLYLSSCQGDVTSESTQYLLSLVDPSQVYSVHGDYDTR